MEIEITSKHLEVEDAVKEKARALGNSLVADFPNQKITAIRVLFATQRNLFPVEVLVNAKNLTLHAAASDKSSAASLAKAFTKINTQMERFLKKIQDASVKADPKTKDKIWNSSDLRIEDDDADLDDYTFALEEK